MVVIQAPLVASIQITGRCNLDCKYCYAWPLTQTDIPKEKILALIEQLVDHGIFEIIIDGGEPFLHPKFIDILRNLDELCIEEIGIATNGTLLTKDTVKELVKLRDYLYGKIQVSLDSHIPNINDKTRGLGDRVLRNLEYLIKAELNPSIATVVHKQNIGVADKIIDYFYPRITRYHYMNLMPTAKSMKNKGFLLPSWKELEEFWSKLELKSKTYTDAMISYPYSKKSDFKTYRRIKSSGCLAGLTRIAIDPELNVLACSIAKNSIMGNLNDYSFDDVWFSKRAEEIRSRTYPLCEFNLR